MEDKDLEFVGFDCIVSEGDIVTNFHTLKEELKVQIEPFLSYVVVDETQVPEAKKIIANLRKVHKAINLRRLQTKEQFMVPYKSFEKEVKDLLALLDEPISSIDSAVKKYEQTWRDDKLRDIQTFFNENNEMNYIELSNIMEESWLNQTTSDKKWKSELLEKLQIIRDDIDVIGRLDYTEVEKSQILLDYVNLSLDLSKALSSFKQRNEKIETMITKVPSEQATVTISKERYEELLDTEKLYFDLIGGN